MTRRLLHLTRRPDATPPAAAVGAADTVAAFDELAVERVLELVLAHDVVVVWGDGRAPTPRPPPAPSRPGSDAA